MSMCVMQQHCQVRDFHNKKTHKNFLGGLVVYQLVLRGSQ
jgi:hypothetical protein